MDKLTLGDLDLNGERHRVVEVEFIEPERDNAKRARDGLLSGLSAQALVLVLSFGVASIGVGGWVHDLLFIVAGVLLVAGSAANLWTLAEES